MKVLVTGIGGQLGHDCMLELKKDSFFNGFGVDINDLDITNEDDVLNFVRKIRPDVIIHCAAWTNVDGAEKSKEKAYSVNVLGTKYIVEAAKFVNAKVLYISTDYVFDGSGSKPFQTESKTNPLNYYGITKLGGEENVRNYKKSFIVRTSWVFGLNGNNFVKTMINLSEKNDELSIVGDQVGSPTYTKDLAVLIVNMIRTEKYGIYHATNEGFCSWAEFANEIFKKLNRTISIHNVTTEEFERIRPNQAKRPLNSRLDKTCLDGAGFKRLPTWEDALSRYLKEIGF